MPVNVNDNTIQPLHQRELFAKSRITRIFWMLQDNAVINQIPKSSKRLVDFGCGEGITLGHISSLFPDCECKGIDYIDENIAICKSHKLDVAHGDIYNLDMPQNSIDVAVFMHVIEHLERPVDAIKSIYNTLKPGGKIIVAFPNDTLFYYARIICGKWKEANYDYGHLQKWSPRKVISALESVGFNKCKSINIPLGIWAFSLSGIVTAEK